MKITHLLVFSLTALTSTLFGQDFVEIAIRSEAEEHFTENFRFTEPAMEWTGDSISGNAGATSSGFRLAIFDQINYFRVQAGVQEVTENPEYSAKAQEASLMISVNRKLDHNPTEDWIFYSEAGREAAGKSNLYLGVNGIEAIKGYIDDPGANNKRVGHRNWILRPQTLTMGTGDVPINAGYFKSNALWVVTSESQTRATRSSFNCWPPANGYTPYQVVYSRWSFKSKGADLSDAAVEMWDAEGQPISLAIEYQPTGSWHPLVWIPEIESSHFYRPRSAPAEDEWYRVRITGIGTGDGPEVVDYTVVIFDPEKEVSTQEVLDLKVINAGANINLNWATPDQAAWTLQQSEDLKFWRDASLEIQHNGFRAQTKMIIESDKLFFRLVRKT